MRRDSHSEGHYKYLNTSILTLAGRETCQWLDRDLWRDWKRRTSSSGPATFAAAKLVGMIQKNCCRWTPSTCSDHLTQYPSFEPRSPSSIYPTAHSSNSEKDQILASYNPQLRFGGRVFLLQVSDSGFPLMRQKGRKTSDEKKKRGGMGKIVQF